MNDSKGERLRIHDKETHGRSEDIDENTSPEKVKAPNLIERAKEEVEALVEAIHPHPKKHHDQQTLGIAPDSLTEASAICLLVYFAVETITILYWVNLFTGIAPDSLTQAITIFLCF